MSTQASKNSHIISSLSEITTYQAGIIQSAMQRKLKQFTDDCLKPHGITTMQWFIIGCIHDAGHAGITMTDLSKTVGTNLPYITNTLNLLESKNIVTKIINEKDTRSRMVTIDESFTDTFHSIESDLRHQMRTGLYASVSPVELKAYLQVVQKLSAKL